MTSSARSYIMSRIRSKDTKPELLVRKYLYTHGYRFRKNVQGLPGTPDIVMLKYRCCIFVHGCFWHGHYHIRYPRTNADFWHNKIARNQRRDTKDKERLRRMGWYVITVWECQLTPSRRQRTLLALQVELDDILLKNLLCKQPRPLPYPTTEADPLPAAAEDQASYGTATDKLATS